MLSAIALAVAAACIVSAYQLLRDALEDIW